MPVKKVRLYGRDQATIDVDSAVVGEFVGILEPLSRCQPLDDGPIVVGQIREMAFSSDNSGAFTALADFLEAHGNIEVREIVPGSIHSAHAGD